MIFDRACVCVPARDEAERLPGLLASLAAQEPGQRLPVVLLLNNCVDATADVARICAATYRDQLSLRIVERNYEVGDDHVGTARREAMALGAGWLRDLGGADPVLLTTDADAVAPPGWVAANLAAIDDGADVVGGYLMLDPLEGERDPVLARMDAAYGEYWRLVRALADRDAPDADDPPPRHGDHTGGSLAVRLAWHDRVGGVPSLPVREDVEFVRRLVAAGARLRHPTAVTMHVSARTVGRAAGGMADEIKRRDQAARVGTIPLVPGALAWQHAFAEGRAVEASELAHDTDLLVAIRDLRAMVFTEAFA
jgi:hypothetical protein